MREDDGQQQASPSAAEITTDSTIKTVRGANKRPAPETGEGHGAMAVGPKMKTIKVGALYQLQKGKRTVPKELYHISIPPVVTLGNKEQVGANYMLPATMNTNSRDIFPKDEDVSAAGDAETGAARDPPVDAPRSLVLSLPPSHFWLRFSLGEEEGPTSE